MDGSAIIGMAAGVLSGLLGIGGGILMVPAFSAWVGLPLKETIATSLACVGIFAIPGTITHAYLGHIDWTFAVALAVGVIPGAQIGAHFTINADDRTLRYTRRHRARDHRGRSTRVGEICALDRARRARANTASSIVGREPAGERVLLARVERADDRHAAARHLEPVREPRPPGRELDAGEPAARSVVHAAS